MEKENGRTGIQLLRWSYPFYGRVLRDKKLKSRKKNPTKCTLIKRKRVKKKESSDLQWFRGQWFRVWTQGQTFCHYHGTCGHTTDDAKITGHTSKTEEMETLPGNKKVHQTWGKYNGAETGRESPEKEEKELYWWTTGIQENQCFWFWPGID